MSSPISRRRVLVLGGAGVVAVVAGPTGWIATTDNGPGPTGTGSGAAATGAELAAPPLLDSSEGRLQIELVAAPGVRLAGRDTRALGSNGTSPGPTLRARPGDELAVRLTDSGRPRWTGPRSCGSRRGRAGWVLLAPVSALLSSPFTPADRAAGYRYDIAIWQAEFSLTQVLDRPISGRVFFEQVIRDNLDAGRPDQVALIFDRRLKRTGPRATPGPFRTRVITEGVTPSLHIDYKHTKIKQYHKEGRALRTETTINDPATFRSGNG